MSSIKAFNPETKDLSYNFRISQKALEIIKGRGSRGDLQIALNLVVPTLQQPTAIFRGLLREEEKVERHSGPSPFWLCYCSRPYRDFDDNGNECDPHPRKVFVVYVNDEHVFYEWRWEDADLNEFIANKIYLPENYRTRYKERLL